MFHILSISILLLFLLALLCFLWANRYLKKRKEKRITLLRQFHSRLLAATSEILGKAEQIDLAAKYITDKPPDFDRAIRLTCSELVILTDCLQSMKADIDRGQIKDVPEQMLISATTARQLAEKLNSISYVQRLGRS
jgi:hypothetical protein